MELVDVSTLQGKDVLEVGCGAGELSVFMALHGARVSGFDLSKVGVEKAARLAAINGVAERCNFSVQNASDMSFADDSFDIVIYNAVLHHALKYPNVREETWRVLRAGGLCAFAEGIRGDPVYRAARALKRAITGEQVKGDIDIDVGDLTEFLEGYAQQRMEFMCLTLGIKRVVGKMYGNPAGVRAIYFALTQFDRLLLALMPYLKAYCSEVVGLGRKPGGGLVKEDLVKERQDAC